MQYTANTTRRRLPDRAAVQHSLDEAREWCNKPMTARAECATAALTGAIMFLLFFAAYMAG